MYELLTEMASKYQAQRQGQVHSESVYPQVKEPVPDDDASVIHVSGFTLCLVEYTTLNKVYITLIKKMLHTINNDFLKNVSLLDNNYSY